MTNRVPTEAQKMEELRNEMFTRKQFLEALLKEAYQLAEKAKTPEYTAEDERRANEISYLAKAHTEFINKNKEKVRKYFSPAVVINAV